MKKLKNDEQRAIGGEGMLRSSQIFKHQFNSFVTPPKQKLKTFYVKSVS
jgi:hypothetical protein